MNKTLSLEALQGRKQRLEEIRAALKREFFGIDKQINAVIDSIQTWWLMPDAVTRPILVSLWGLTGCGKTSLVRSLVNHLGLTNAFVEVSMDGFSSAATSDIRTISGLLRVSGIEEGKPGIILLDEFQRFRTINDKGEDIRLERYSDVWMLLSDGRFPSDYRKLEKIIDYMTMQEYYEDMWAYEKAEREARVESNKPKTPEYSHPIQYKRHFVLSHSEASDIKEMLRLSEPIKEVMTWEKEKVKNIIQQHLDAKRDVPYDYSKCLVFISGNLDEAYRMAGSVEDCDTSAEVFYQYTLKIGVPEIKAALSTRFRPEQIARFGNNHVVYPSLTEDAYMKLIRRSCREYTEQAEAICGVSFLIDAAVYDEIYANSVYPTQGTRPVFTSIHKLFGSPLSDGILWALENNISKVTVGLDIPSSSLVFHGGALSKAVPIDFEIRARRASRSADFTALVAVHEAGHAIVYASLLKRSPVEVAINVASFKGGYNIFEDTFLCKAEALDRIATSMGGIVAEELVFGQELRSTGCESDVSKATRAAAQYVRRWAMDGSHGTVATSLDSLTLMDVEATDAAVETIVKEQKARAQSMLTQYRSLLIELSHELIRTPKMDGKAFVAFVGDRIAGLEVAREKDVSSDYAARLAAASTPVTPTEEDRKTMREWVRGATAMAATVVRA